MFSFSQQTIETPSTMSQGGGSDCGSGGGGGMEFNLPEEILAVMPTDPYEQLDLARKITSMAIASRVSKMEAEMGRMRAKVYEKERVIYELEEKVSRLQQANHEAESRLKLIFDENMKLSKERDSLAMTTKKLSRDLTKLETFKRQLMQSLNDDNSSQAETVDIGTCDQSVPKAYPDNDDGMKDYMSLRSSNGSMDLGSCTTDEASRYAGQRFSITPYITPRLTPTGTPKIISTNGSPRGYSAAVSPQRTSGATSPTKSQSDGRTSFSSWYPSSQQSSAANSPPRGRSLPGRTPRIDGKEFFRQARSRLSYEQFSAFLANIKELNAQKQSRAETLRKAEEIFGTDNKDLFLLFQGLLNRNIH
ncbi:NAI2-interacting protein 2 [Hibiscus trionum]|uniref:NAI2-interacting protein 2 n=2 Tax=Hibiscus trionum TaxID=183268 RepID=A0A9W7GV20_HIBTR|nr:NAI2-interacting protein 2 [Hibiscus trionum]